MKKTDLGVFLHRTAYSETSLIVWFYTRQGGLQKFIFKGGKKKAHALFPMSLSELTFYGKEDADLLNLVSAETVSPPSFISNPIKVTVAFFMAETIRKCVQHGDKDAGLFLFIEDQIQRLNDKNDVSLLPLEFLIEGTIALGFHPLCDDPAANVFNLDAGVFQFTLSNEQRTQRGEGVDLILEMILNQENKEDLTKKAKVEALGTMMEYYKIHVPKFDMLSSYEIVKEVLQG